MGTPPASSAGPVVVLVGPPGSGKSSVGRELAARTGLALRDTDTDVEELAGRSIADVFTIDGEQRFRELERAAVAAALAEHTGVLALGGGAVLAEQTRALLVGHRVAYLSIGMPVGVRRTGLAANRPLLIGINPRATFKALLDARVPLYREVATIEVKTDELTVEQVAQVILAELEIR